MNKLIEEPPFEKGRDKKSHQATFRMARINVRLRRLFVDGGQTL